MKICISGAIGAGKSSIIKEIVKRFGYKTADVGQIFRARAVEKGMTIDEYDKLIEQNPEEDKAMEQAFKKLIEETEGDVIVSRRMGFYIMPQIPSIWLDVTEEEGAKRVFNDNRGVQEKKYQTWEEALAANRARTERIKKRLLNVYGVDFTDKSNYTYVLDTTNKTLKQVVDEVIKIIEIEKAKENKLIDAKKEKN